MASSVARQSSRARRAQARARDGGGRSFGRRWRIGIGALTEMMVAAVEGGDRASNAVSNGSDLWNTLI